MYFNFLVNTNNKKSISTEVTEATKMSCAGFNVRNPILKAVATVDQNKMVINAKRVAFCSFCIFEATIQYSCRAIRRATRRVLK